MIHYKMCLFYACVYMRESDCGRAKGHKRQWCCPLFWWCRAGVRLYESRWVYYACLLSLARRAAFRCLFTEPLWHTVWCQVLLCRCVVPALLAIIFFHHVFLSAFPLQPTSKKKEKEKRYWLLFMSTLEDLELQSWRSEWRCANLYERGRQNQCFLKVNDNMILFTTVIVTTIKSPCNVCALII